MTCFRGEEKGVRRGRESFTFKRKRGEVGEVGGGRLIRQVDSTDKSSDRHFSSGCTGS